ncbi:MAG: hypothetical protein OSB42_04135 [Planctomycetota bacterium]|nr:hypothetical protein [Planctomycetota bacterium]
MKVRKPTLLALWILVLLELGAWGTCSLISHRALSYGGLREMQIAAALTGLGSTSNAPDLAFPGRREARAMRRDARHPYLGHITSFGSERETEGLHYTWLQGPGLGNPDLPCFGSRDDVFVVGVTGGSVAAGICSEACPVLLKTLSDSPRLKGQEVHLVFFANAGFKQPQQHLGLEYLLDLGVGFDAVINLDGFNEIALHPRDNQKQGVSVAYPSQWASHLAMGSTAIAAAGEMRYLEGRRTAAARAAILSPMQRSWVQRLWWLLDDAKLNRDLLDSRKRLEKAITRGNEHNLERTGPVWPKMQPIELSRALVDLWSRSSLHMHQSLEAIGAVYVHCLQPNQYVPGSKPNSEEELNHILRPDGLYAQEVRRSYPGLRQEGNRLADQGLHFFDLTGLFEEHPETLYKDDCCHLNGVGTALLAEAIAEALLSVLD